jgi:hypothetical protein
MGAILVGCGDSTDEKKKVNNIVSTQNLDSQNNSNPTTQNLNQNTTDALNLDETGAKNLDKQNSDMQEKIDKISNEKNQTAQILLAKSQNTNAIFPGDKTPEQFFAQKCAVCHGKKGEKNSMLPTMRVMNKVSKDELFSVMKDYQNGVGGKLKATMLTQLNGLNDEQIEALAQLIASFGEK